MYSCVLYLALNTIYTNQKHNYPKIQLNNLEQKTNRSLPNNLGTYSHGYN